jgi:hypothetical protein
LPDSDTRPLFFRQRLWRVDGNISVCEEEQPIGSNYSAAAMISADRMARADPADPELLDEPRRALEALTRILGLPTVYPVQVDVCAARPKKRRRRLLTA